MLKIYLKMEKEEITEEITEEENNRRRKITLCVSHEAKTTTTIYS